MHEKLFSEISNIILAPIGSRCLLKQPIHDECNPIKLICIVQDTYQQGCHC